MEKFWIIRNSLLLNKRFGLILIFILFNFGDHLLKSQNNLVPNGGFESFTICPNNSGQLTYAFPWFQPNKAGGSSDAYNACNSTIPNVPYCPAYQMARSGNGLAGICLFHDTTSSFPDQGREYLEVGLTDTLVANKKYCVRYYAVKGNWSMWAVKNIQAVLTTDSLFYNDFTYSFIPGQNIISEADTIVQDTINWTKIQSIYNATGGERFLTIGNFNSGSNTSHKLTLPYSTIPNTLGYYLFDDFSIYELPDYNAGLDDTICPWHNTIIGPQYVRSDVQYSWSPTLGLDNPNVPNPMASPLVNTSYVLTVTDTNQYACNSTLIDTVLITVQGCVGINAINQQEFNFELFPNPAANFLIITCNSNMNLKLIDPLGKVLKEIPINSPNTKVQLTNIPNGVYLVQNDLFSKTLIIQR